MGDVFQFLSSASLEKLTGRRAETLDDLLHAGRTVVSMLKPSDELIETVKPLAEELTPDGDLTRAYVESEENVFKILDLVRAKGNLVSVVPQRQTLEDLFVEIVREVRK